MKAVLSGVLSVVTAIMAVISLIAVAASSSNAFAETYSRSQCVDVLKSVNKELKMTEDRWGVGEITKDILDTARLNVLDARLDCRDGITFDQYCDEAIPMSASVILMVEENVKLGHSDFADLERSRRNHSRRENLCK